jgi:hypothetical protein
LILLVATYLAARLSILFWREFAPLDVARVDLVKCFHFSGKSSGPKIAETGQTGTHARQSIHSMGINVKLRDFVECGATVVVGRVLLGVDAIYGAGVDAGGVLHPMQGSAMTYAIGQ